MKQIHQFFKRIAISTILLVALALSTNIAFAKNRVSHRSINRPRIYLIARHRKIKHSVRRWRRIEIKKRDRRVRRHGRKNVRKVHRHRSVKRFKRHFRKRHARKKAKRNRNRDNHKRQGKANRRYDIFNNASLRHFKVLNNSTRVNSRMPGMKLVMTFPNTYHGSRRPQSINLNYNSHYAYIGFDSFANDGSKVMKYDLYRHHFSKIGPTFSGGHAQAVSVDHHGNLWFLNRKSNDYSDDHSGPIKIGSFIEVSPRSLKPFYYKNFRFGHNYMGDNLTFAGPYGVFNLSRIWARNRTNRHYRKHMLVIYHTNRLDRHNNQWSLVEALRHTPGDYIIQATDYNPKDERLYIASSRPTHIVSMPVEKILKHSLRKKDIHIAAYHLGHQREIEGLTFDHKGYMYLLLGSPGQLLRSRRPVTK